IGLSGTEPDVPDQDVTYHDFVVAGNLHHVRAASFHGGDPDLPVAPPVCAEAVDVSGKGQCQALPRISPAPDIERYLALKYHPVADQGGKRDIAICRGQHAPAEDQEKDGKLVVHGSCSVGSAG